MNRFKFTQLNFSMNTNPNIQEIRCRSARLRNVISMAICLLAACLMIGCSSKPLVPTRPLAKGDVMIHVKFKCLFGDHFNSLTEFIEELAEEQSAFEPGSTTVRRIGDRNAFCGIWNNGFIDQAYTPIHPIPNPEVEAQMRAKFETYIREHGINPRRVKFEVRYGL